jgi:hypothetical protein
MSGIGLLNEKPLHASLKKWYAQPGDRFEVAVDGYVIDIVRDDLLLEIQTGNFASIKSKVTNLVRSHQLRLIYPIAQEKWIAKPAKDDSSGVSRRKSPKRGRMEDLFWEMVSLPQLLSNRVFSTKRESDQVDRQAGAGQSIQGDRRLTQACSRRPGLLKRMYASQSLTGPEPQLNHT